MAVKSACNSRRCSREHSTTEAGELLMEEPDLLNPFAVGVWVPPVDICHSSNRIRVRVELPGVDISDVSLSYQNGNLRIRGIKREQEHSHKLLCYYCLERRYGKFDRQISITSIVNPRQSRAYLNKGILTVELPKLQERRGDAVEIHIEKK